MSTVDYVLPHLEPILPFLSDPEVSEVMVIDGGLRIFYERNGVLVRVPNRCIHPDRLHEAITNIAKQCGAVVDEKTAPML